MNLYHMLVRGKKLVCWENRCSLLWDFTSRNLVESPVMSIVTFEDSAGIKAGIEDVNPRSSLYYNITLQWEVYIEKTFTNFPLLLQLFDWTGGQSFAARSSPSSRWLQLDIEKCLLLHRSHFVGHRASGVPCWWEHVEIRALYLWWPALNGVQISLMSPRHNRQQCLLHLDLCIRCLTNFSSFNIQNQRLIDS